MFLLRAKPSRLLSGMMILGASLACTMTAAAMSDTGTASPFVGERTYVAQAKATQDDNFKKAMELLRPSTGAKPSREDVERAGHMLMEAGPDAFERAMNLLKMPNVRPSDVAAAKQEMMKGGPTASDKAMQLLRQSYGY